jgi:hypothetical protein
MRAHLGTSFLVEEAADVMHVLCLNHLPGALRLVRCGAAPLLVASLRAHSRDAAVQQKAMRALRDLSWHPGELRAALQSAGAIQAVVAALLQAHRSGPPSTSTARRTASPPCSSWSYRHLGCCASAARRPTPRASSS